METLKVLLKFVLGNVCEERSPLAAPDIAPPRRGTVKASSHLLAMCSGYFADYTRTRKEWQIFLCFSLPLSPPCLFINTPKEK